MARCEKAFSAQSVRGELKRVLSMQSLSHLSFWPQHGPFQGDAALEGSLAATLRYINKVGHLLLSSLVKLLSTLLLSIFLKDILTILCFSRIEFFQLIDTSTVPKQHGL